MSRISFLILLAVQLFAGVTSDLPLHCLHSQAVGTWLFKHGSNSHDDSLTVSEMFTLAPCIFFVRLRMISSCFAMVTYTYLNLCSVGINFQMP